MFLKATISARTAEASEWWSVQIRNELIKNEHAQNSLWYLNSCLWNPVQELHGVTIYIIILQVTVFHTTSRAQISRTLNTRTVSPSCLLLVLFFYHAFTMSGKQPIWCKQGQSRNTDLVFHVLMLSWENENRYKILWTTAGLGPVVLNRWFEHLSATWENQLPTQVWASEVWQWWKW